MLHDTAMGSGSGIHTALGCDTVCLETISHCLTKGGDHANADHVKLLQDCAEICQTAASFMVRELVLHAETCSVCAEAWRQCAQSCRQMASAA